MRRELKSMLIGAVLCVPVAMVGQEFLPADSVRAIKFKKNYAKVENHSFFMLGADEKNKVSAINGYEIPAFTPETWTIAPIAGGNVLFSKGRNVSVKDVFAGEEDNERHIIKIADKKATVSRLAYSPDATYVLVVDSNNKLTKCITDATVKKDKRVCFSLQLSAAPSEILINNAANAALITMGTKVAVLNLERGTVRKELDFGTNVADVAYSADCREFAVLLADGKLKLIDVASLGEKKSYEVSGTVTGCGIMNQGKYAVVANADKFVAINLITSHIDYILTADNTDLKYFDMFEDSFGHENLLAFHTGSMSQFNLSTLERYHTMDLKNELDLRMAEWSKMLPGESQDEYRNRVNDESRAQYALQLEREIATGMAGDLIGQQEAKFGNYFEGNQALAIDFSEMPSIYLNIPAEDLKDLKTIDDLEFFNTQYGLTADDKFEVIYTEARNKTTGKTYIYDNLQRKSMAFDEESFVPMEVVQLASIEAAKLEEVKEEVVTAAKNDNILTDHTHITVTTEVEKDVDADGNKILNYLVNYQYEVEEEFSARDDFKAGKYNTAESNAAVQMIEIVKNSLKGDFAKYLTDSKRLEVSVTGSADATPIIGTLAYKGEYGDLKDQLVYQNGELSTMSVTKAKGITSNEQLALVRAVGVADYLNKNVLAGTAIDTSYKYFIDVAKEKGSQYRRIKVSLKFIDTFKKM